MSRVYLLHQIKSRLYHKTICHCQNFCIIPCGHKTLSILDFICTAPDSHGHRNSPLMVEFKTASMVWMIPEKPSQLLSNSETIEFDLVSYDTDHADPI